MRLVDQSCPCCEGPHTRFRAPASPLLECNGCGHQWRAQPDRDVNYRIQSMRTVPRADHLARKFDERIKFIGDLRQVARVLEVGCAEGHFAAELLARHPHLYLVGIEPSQDAELASRVFHRVYRAPLADASIDSGNFDVVMAFHVLEHDREPVAACSALSDALGVEGRLFIEVPHGSGNERVPEDRNPEHVHFYTTASISCLMHRVGLEVRDVQCGGFESPLYNDSLRVRARRRVSSDAKIAGLQARIRQLLGPHGAIWGVGGDFENYVRPYLRPEDPVLLVDSSPERQGAVIDGRRVQPPEVLAGGVLRHVLIASYRHELSIRKSLSDLAVPAKAVRTLTDLVT